jgi:hypothetical protein
MIPKSNNNFHEIQLEEFTDKVGEAMFEQATDLIHLTFSYVKPPSIRVDFIIYHTELDDSFQIYMKDTQELVLVFEKNFTGQHFIKPFKLIKDLGSKFVKEIDSKGLEYDDNIIFELKSIHSLKDEDRLSDYLYYMSLLFVDQLNLSINKTKLIFFNNETILIDGAKEEYIDVDLNTTNMIYLITILTKENYVKIVKIDENNNQQELIIDLYDFFLKRKING